MLELMKKVLENLSNDTHYFKKEFLKAKNWLSEEEFSELVLHIQNTINNISHLELITCEEVEIGE